MNELIARMTDSEPEDSTTTNKTLNADGKTFPRGGKRFFVVSRFAWVMSLRAEDRTSPMTTK